MAKQPKVRRIFYGFGDAVAIPTPPDLTCAYPFSASEAEIISLGFDGKLPLSVDEQTGTYTIVGNLGAEVDYSAGNLVSPVEFDSGVKAVEFNYSLPNVSGGVSDAIFANCVVFTNPVSVSAIVSVVLIALSNNSWSALVVVDGVTQNTTVGIAQTGTVSIIMDANLGTVSVVLNGTPLVLADNTYTPQTALLGILITEKANVPLANAGLVTTLTMVSSAADMTGTYDPGTTDICGNEL